MESDLYLCTHTVAVAVFAAHKFVAPLFDLRARYLHELAPFIVLGTYVSCEFVRCARHYVEALCRDLFACCGLAQYLYDFRIQFGDDVSRYSRGTDDCDPVAEIEAGKASFYHRRRVR